LLRKQRKTLGGYFILPHLAYFVYLVMHPRLIIFGTAQERSR